MHSVFSAASRAPSWGANGRRVTTNLSCLANPLGNTRDKRSTHGSGVWQIKEACSTADANGEAAAAELHLPNAFAI